MVYADEKFELHKGVKIAFGVVIGIAVVIAVLLVTGAWDYIYERIFLSGAESNLTANIIFIVIIGIALAVVLASPKKKSD